MSGGLDQVTIDRLTRSFETARLIVRLVEERDLEGLLAVNRDDEVTRFLPYGTWRSIDDAQAWLVRIDELQAEGKLRQFVVIERDVDEVVGALVLFNVDGSGRAEVGYVVGRRGWGRGLAREALRSLLTHAFDDLALRRIDAHVDPRNVASHRLLIALGFEHEGTIRERSVVKGEVVDSGFYGLLAREWRDR